MHVHVHGCGFAGVISALGLCRNGLTVSGLDVDLERLRALKTGHDPRHDTVVNECLKKYHRSQIEFFHVEEIQRIPKPSLHVVTVPTPQAHQGLDLSFVKNSLLTILHHFPDSPQIVLRSTLPLGGFKKIVDAIQQDSGMTNMVDFQLVYLPEFMREGTGFEDWDHPPLFVVGVENPQMNFSFLKHFSSQSPQIVSAPEAEAIKLFSNAFHGLKVSFANEVMRICSSLNFSADQVMKVFGSDSKLNISTAYLKPGFAWGGSCLEKDTKALLGDSISTPVLASIVDSNERHIEFYKNLILQNSAHSTIGFLGLSFKDQVSDSRNSASFKLAQLLAQESTVEKIFIYEANLDSIEYRSPKIHTTSDMKILETCNLIIGRKAKFVELKTKGLTFDHIFTL